MLKRLVIIFFGGVSCFGFFQACEIAVETEYTIRKGIIDDRDGFRVLFQKMAAISALGRSPEQITDTLVAHIIGNALKSETFFVAESNGRIIGSVITAKSEPKAFSHVLIEIIIFVDSEYQRQGIGGALMRTLQEAIENHHPEIYRITLSVQEGNPAIHLYKRLGFEQEGVFKGAARDQMGKLEDRIFMAWFNPNFDLGAK